MNSLLSSWDLVRAFLTVMRQGSLSSAARKLKISQPTVRRQIEALEAELGLPLFSRSPSGLIATDVATALLAQAEATEFAIGAFRRGASGPAHSETGTVRVTCSDIFGVEIMPGLLSPLMNKYPGLNVELVLTNQSDDLLRREADIAVRLTTPKQAALIARKAAVIELGLFASDAFLKTNPSPKNATELSQTARFIGDDRKDVIARGFAAAKLAPAQNLVFRSDNDLAQLSAIRNGIGIGICQVHLAKRSNLIRVLSNITVTLDCWVVMHEDLKHMKRIRLVFDHLVKALGKRPK
jgi:DNA-binding transcriptional LysR family regulator